MNKRISVEIRREKKNIERVCEPVSHAKKVMMKGHHLLNQKVNVTNEQVRSICSTYRREFMLTGAV